MYIGTQEGQKAILPNLNNCRYIHQSFFDYSPDRDCISFVFLLSDRSKSTNAKNILVVIKAQGLTVLGSGFLLFLNVTYEAMEEESGTGDLVLGGTIPTG